MSFLRNTTSLLKRVGSIPCPLRCQPTTLFNHCKAPISIRVLNTEKDVFEAVQARDPSQSEFLQAVDEVIVSCQPLFRKKPDYIRALPIICEPERIIQFRVPWVDDNGHTHVNRGFRVQFSQALGPYKGGLRFHPSVNQSIIKFLGFEQIFKNALTGLPMGGGKGGSDFNPREKSEAEVLRFCQAFMSELFAHIGPDTDVPAGDIGVGAREIGFMFGQWKQITGRCSGVLTGKGRLWGGSHIRPEATGYGVVYITQMALADHGKSFDGARVAISGSGNVAEFTAEKVIELGGIVMSFSDSDGSIIEPDGFTPEQVQKVRDIKGKRLRVQEYTKYSKTCKYYPGERPWKHVKCDVALPSATQNEINEEDALELINNGCYAVSEGANMPTTPKAIELFQKNCLVYIPAKASNAGGVAVSGLEMAQNSARLYWTRDEVDQKLYDIMAGIYQQLVKTSDDLGYPGDFLLGANAAGFQMVADAMFEQGLPLKSWDPVDEEILK